MDALPDPGEDIIAAGAAAVAQRAGTSPTKITNMARELLAQEGFGNSAAERWAGIQEVANIVDEAPHTRSLADRAWAMNQEAARLGRLARRISGGHRYA